MHHTWENERCGLPRRLFEPAPPEDYALSDNILISCFLDVDLNQNRRRTSQNVLPIEPLRQTFTDLLVNAIASFDASDRFAAVCVWLLEWLKFFFFAKALLREYNESVQFNLRMRRSRSIY